MVYNTAGIQWAQRDRIIGWVSREWLDWVLRCHLNWFWHMFDNESHQSEANSRIFSGDLRTRSAPGQLIQHAAWVEKLFSYQLVVSNHNTWEECWLFIGCCGTDATMRSSSTTVICIKFPKWFSEAHRYLNWLLISFQMWNRESLRQTLIHYRSFPPNCRRYS
jgi:hypothetical protein